VTFSGIGLAIFDQGRFMSILSIRSAERFSIFKRSLLQSNDLPLTEILDAQLIATVFQEQQVEFGKADEDVFTPAITLWAMVSQFLFSGTGESDNRRRFVRFGIGSDVAEIQIGN